MKDRNIVIVGAGVSGLTTAYLLAQRSEYKVTVVAKHMPGDYDIEYASPWAGANFMPVSRRGTAAAEHDKNTWPFLEQLAERHPDAGVHFQTTKIFNRKKDVGSATVAWFADLLSPDPWWKDLIRDFREIPKADLPEGMDNANEFTSVCINTAIYLPWLLSQCLKNGVVFKRGVFSHISSAAAAGVHHSGSTADLVINCTGLSSRSLGGVEDQTVNAARGQIVVVRNDAGAMYSVSGTDDGSDEAMYIMTRAAGGGTILGGSYQKGDWNREPDANLATRIMKRCVEACPHLTQGRGIEHLDIIRHAVGLRPVREGGARIEKETIEGVQVVHNYGHGGFGYQASYGCSQAVVELVDQAFRKQSKL